MNRIDAFNARTPSTNFRKQCVNPISGIDPDT